MTTQLPVPVRFELPGPDWTPVRPEELGVENAAFLAVRRGLPGDYDPTITISGGLRTDDADVEQVADESVAKLRGQARDVELVKRRRVGTEASPAVIQTLGAVIDYGGRSFDLRQLQVVQALVDVDQPARRVVLICTLTCTYAQYEQVAPEFQTFVGTIEVLPGEGVAASAPEPRGE